MALRNSNLEEPEAMHPNTSVTIVVNDNPKSNIQARLYVYYTLALLRLCLGEYKTCEYLSSHSYRKKSGTGTFNRRGQTTAQVVL